MCVWVFMSVCMLWKCDWRHLFPFLAALFLLRSYSRSYVAKVTAFLFYYDFIFIFFISSIYFYFIILFFFQNLLLFWLHFLFFYSWNFLFSFSLYKNYNIFYVFYMFFFILFGFNFSVRKAIFYLKLAFYCCEIILNWFWIEFVCGAMNFLCVQVCICMCYHRAWVHSIFTNISM